MPAGHHPHGQTAYAPPVTVRAPSPASSIGTLYDDDATSEHEARMSEMEFIRFCEDKIKLNQPRPEEERAEREPLIKDQARGKGGEQELALFEKIVANLRAEIKRLEEEEIYERALMKGSQIGLEQQAPTSDIDKIMRSMMGSGFSVTSEAQTTTSPSETQPTQPAVAPGPWNNYGKKPATLKKTNPFPSIGLAQMTASGNASSSSAAPTTSLISSTTAGTHDMHPADTTGEPMNVDDHSLELLPPGSPDFAPPAWATSTPNPNAGMTGGGSSDGTVIGGKRTRSGLVRR